jgi:colicin import membrane protein
LPELSLAIAQAEEGLPSEPSKTWSRVVVGTWVAALLAACFGLLVLVHQRDEAVAAAAEHAAELAAQKAQTDKLIAELRAQTESLATLQSAVQNAKDDAARASAQAQLDEVRRSREAVNAAMRARAGGSSAGGAAIRAACNCTPGDPLCSCIP